MHFPAIALVLDVEDFDAKQYLMTRNIADPERQPSQNSSATTHSLSNLYSKETEAFQGKDSMPDPIFSFGG